MAHRGPSERQCTRPSRPWCPSSPTPRWEAFQEDDIPYDETMKAAWATGRRQEVLDRIRALVKTETFGERFVTKVLGKELALR